MTDTNEFFQERHDHLSKEYDKARVTYNIANISDTVSPTQIAILKSIRDDLHELIVENDKAWNLFKLQEPKPDKKTKAWWEARERSLKGQVAKSNLILERNLKRSFLTNSDKERLSLIIQRNQKIYDQHRYEYGLFKMSTDPRYETWGEFS